MLEVRDGDVPKVVAAAFARRHKLDDAVRGEITQAILDKAVLIRDSGTTTSAAVVSDELSATTIATPPSASSSPPPLQHHTPLNGPTPPPKQPKGKLLVSLDVALDVARGVVPLAIHEGDYPAEVARAFAAQYDLGEDAIGQVATAVAQHLDAHAEEQARDKPLGRGGKASRDNGGGSNSKEDL